MSTKIGIVSEGASDFWALQHIVERYLKDSDVYTIPLKPRITPAGRQDGFGSWQGVFEYISGTDEDKLIIEAQNEDCRFVIIQIDTDVCNEYGIEKDLSDHNLFHNNIRQKLLHSIHADFNKSIVVFAICIHELECWLLPFVCTQDKCTIVDNCLNSVNRAIRTRGSIDKGNKNCDAARRLYQYIFNFKKKPRDIKECAEHNFGFKSFIEQLDAIKEILEQEALEQEETEE